MGLTAMPIYNITKDTNVTELEDTMHSDNWMMRASFALDTSTCSTAAEPALLTRVPPPGTAKTAPKGSFFLRNHEQRRAQNL